MEMFRNPEIVLEKSNSAPYITSYQLPDNMDDDRKIRLTKQTP